MHDRTAPAKKKPKCPELASPEESETTEATGRIQRTQASSQRQHYPWLPAGTRILQLELDRVNMGTYNARIDLVWHLVLQAPPEVE